MFPLDRKKAKIKPIIIIHHPILQSLKLVESSFKPTTKNAKTDATKSQIPLCQLPPGSLVPSDSSGSPASAPHDATTAACQAFGPPAPGASLATRSPTSRPELQTRSHRPPNRRSGVSASDLSGEHMTKFGLFCGSNLSKCVV